MSERIQLRRSAGWRKPDGVVVVARPTRWGNPFRFGGDSGVDRAEAVRRFGAWLEATPEGQALAKAAQRELRGRDLACWCPVDGPCHADFLLQVANR